VDERACAFFSSHLEFMQNLRSRCHFEGIGPETKFC